MKNYYVFLAGMFLFVLFPFSALAIPTLGVAPSVSDYGVYNGPAEDYLSYFADEYVNDWGDAGFILPESGGSLSVWYGGDIFKEIVLSTNSAAGDSFAFDGIDFTAMYATNQGQIDGYKEQVLDGDGEQFSFFGASLGSVNSNNNWQALDGGAWGNGTFYIYTAPITYSNFQPDQEDWIFAISDQNGDNYFEGVDKIAGGEFSPKTTSGFGASNPVPEPATLLLLGTGLAGLAGFRRKKKGSMS